MVEGGLVPEVRQDRCQMAPVGQTSRLVGEGGMLLGLEGPEDLPCHGEVL